MSLNWDLREVKDFEELRDSEGNLDGVTHSLIFMTVGVGLGGITEKNWTEFYARLKLLERLDGPFLNRGEEKVEFTPEMVKRRVGLKANVTDETRAKWLGRLKNDLNRYRWEAQKWEDEAA